LTGLREKCEKQSLRVKPNGGILKREKGMYIAHQTKAKNEWEEENTG